MLPAESRKPLVGQIFRSRGGKATLSGMAMAGIASAFAPLADHLGFEFALVLTLAAAFFAPAAGMAGARLAPMRPLRGAIAGIVVSLTALLIPIFIILVNGFRRPSCDPWAGSTWILVLPVPAAFLAASLGAFTRSWSRSTRGAVVKLVGLYAVSLAPGLWLLWAGPGFFLFDHVFGYFPGPLYDEVVVLSSSVWIWRALTLAWAAVALVGCVREPKWMLAAAALALLTLGVELRFGSQIGLRSTDHSVSETLGAVHRIDDLEIHYPREWSKQKLQQFSLDAAFRASQVREALGVPEGERVRVWIYRSTEEKRRLTGAGRTSFAKPWRQEIHIHDMEHPHPVLRHELVHAYAGQLGAPPFGVPGGLLPNSPLIEGLAVAFDTDAGGLTLAQWAKGMRQLGLAPDMEALLSTTGFFAAAPSRAYTYAGAFIRYLEQSRGRDAVLALYRTGNLASIDDPARLVASFEAWLDEVVVDEDEKATALRRYKRPSVFRRQCAREVSAVTEQAEAFSRKGRPTEALAAWQKACLMEPDDPGLLRGLLRVALSLDNSELAESVTRQIFAHEKTDDPLRASVLLELGDRAWKTGRLTLAQQAFSEAAALVVDSATRRMAVAKTRAVSNPEQSSLLEPLLARGDSGLETLWAMSEYLNDAPHDALVTYLLGRQFVQKKAAKRGLTLLRKAAGNLDDRELERENRRLIVVTAATEGDCDAAVEASALMDNDADRAQAEDWISRCRFVRSRASTAL